MTELVQNKWEPNENDKSIRYMVIGPDELKMDQTQSLDQFYKSSKMSNK